MKCVCSPGGDGTFCRRTDRSGGAGVRGRGLRVGRVDYASRQVPPSRETVRYAVGKRAQLPGAKRAAASSAGVRAHSSATCIGGGVWVAYPCVVRPAPLRARCSQPLTCASHQALLPVPGRKLRSVGNGYRGRVRTLQTATRSLHSHLAASPVAWLSLPRAPSPHLGPQQTPQLTCRGHRRPVRSLPWPARCVNGSSALPVLLPPPRPPLSGTSHARRRPASAPSVESLAFFPPLSPSITPTSPTSDVRPSRYSRTATRRPVRRHSRSHADVTTTPPPRPGPRPPPAPRPRRSRLPAAISSAIVWVTAAEGPRATRPPPAQTARPKSYWPPPLMPVK